MNYEECFIGLSVVAPMDDPECVGEIVDLLDEEVVLVKFPVLGHPGRFDEIEFDPLDIEEVE